MLEGQITTYISLNDPPDAIHITGSFIVADILLSRLISVGIFVLMWEKEEMSIKHKGDDKIICNLRPASKAKHVI